MGAMTSQPLRALIADDEQTQRDQLEEALTSIGFNVVARAVDGLAAVRLAKLYKPDLVMIDILMPNLSGREAALQIRTALPDAKIVMVTSMSQDGVLDELRAQGFGVFVKPIVREAVIETVAQVFA
jgi:AmiR/NasT family two-component response regulator